LKNQDYYFFGTATGAEQKRKNVITKFIYPKNLYQAIKTGVKKFVEKSNNR